MTIRPLNSEAEVQRAIQQGTIIAKHVQEQVVSIFVLERHTNVSDFYRWLTEADRCVGLGLDHPRYIEPETIPIRNGCGPLLTLPRI